MTNIILCATIKWYEASCCLFFSALLFHPLILCFMVVWGIRELGAALEIQLKHNAVLESTLWKLSHGWWLCEKALVRKHFFFFSLLTSACIWPYLSPHTLLWEWTISRYDYTQVWTHRNALGIHYSNHNQCQGQASSCDLVCSSPLLTPLKNGLIDSSMFKAWQIS